MFFCQKFCPYTPFCRNISYYDMKLENLNFPAVIVTNSPKGKKISKHDSGGAREGQGCGGRGGKYPP